MRSGNRFLVTTALAALLAFEPAGAGRAQAEGKCMFSTFPLPCLDGVSCPGATTCMPMPHSGNCSRTANGSWNFAGTKYAGAVSTVPPISGAAWARSEGAFDIVALTLPATPPYYTDPGGPLLIDGAGIRYIHWNERPAFKDPTMYEGWASDPASPDDSRPMVIPWGTSTEVAIRKPPAGLQTYVAVMLHYPDQSVTEAGNPTDFLGSWTTSEARELWPTLQPVRLWAFRAGAHVELLWYGTELGTGAATVTRREAPLGAGTVIYQGTSLSFVDALACEAACPYYYDVQ